MRNLLSIFSFNNKNPADALRIFVAAVVALEAAFAFLPENALITSFKTRVPPAVAPGLLVVGDSVAAGGLRTNVIASVLPRPMNVFNAAIPGTDAEFPYFQLQRLIHEGKAPKEVLVALSPQVFKEDRASLLVGAYCTGPEVIDVASTGIAPAEVAYGLLCRFSYSLRHRQNLARFVLGRGFDGQSKLRDTLEDALSKDVLVATAKPRFPIDPDEAFSASRLNRHYLEKFLTLCAERKMPVYWLLLPTCDEIRVRRNQSGFARDYYRFVAQLQHHHGVVQLNTRFDSLPDGCFIDGVHLNDDGAIKFSTQVGEMLKTATSGGQVAAKP